MTGIAKDIAGCIDTSVRTLRSNIWRGLLSASDQEIRDGLSFYPGAHGLCRLFAAIHKPISTSQVAGIYAALSPTNEWYSNVSNILTILRWARDYDANMDYPLPSVNTYNINRDKAIRIALGEDPDIVLGGRKVRSFYLGISNPDNVDPIPIDRHLINLAFGTNITSNQQLRSIAGNSDVYYKIEKAYFDLGKREGLGNRLASIAWFVKRRMTLTNQSIILHPNSPVCCNSPMYSHGHKPRRWLCKSCGKSRTDNRTVARKYQRSRPLSEFDIQIDIPLDGNTPTWIRPDDGRPVIRLGKHNPYMYKSGYQYLSRFVVQYSTSERLRSDENVHHTNGQLLDCRTDNLEVWLAERHGRHHANIQLLYMLRDKVTGRFVKSDVPRYTEMVAGNIPDDTDDTAVDNNDIPF